MSLCHLACDASHLRLIAKCALFSDHDLLEIELPITGSKAQIDLLIAGPSVDGFTDLAATISDWNTPPVALFIIPAERYEVLSERLHYHPRVGRSIFTCNANSTESIEAGLKACHEFYTKRSTFTFTHAMSANFTTNNISHRWLFQSLMEHLDEYIYFKDKDSKFLAVSNYLATQCGKLHPQEVLGLSDFDLFDSQHSKEALIDEQKLASGELNELSKEELVEVDGGGVAWVASRKLPLLTRSNYLAGTFGLSRNITQQKEMRDRLQASNERMQSELLLARKMQETLMQQAVPDFPKMDARYGLEIATKYAASFHLSGDFYSIVKTDNNHAAILIADVMGHGVRAAMVTTMIQLAVHQLSDHLSEPAEYMRRLNTMLHHSINAAGQTIFATAAYCYIDLTSGQMTYVQAGASHGIFVSNLTRETVPKSFDRDKISPALGLLPRAEYTEATIDLKSGDEILLYTDGVIEASLGDEEFGEDRLAQFLAMHRKDCVGDMVDCLVSDIARFTMTEHLEDDICILGLKVQ
jgi:sigma-B regulation protein RsbU (phosphoserine phosphatase)